MAEMIDDPHMGRKVQEWIGAHPDQKVPDRVRDRIFLRFNGRCAETGVKLWPGDWDLDHTKALADGGQHRESNMRPVSRDRHREKTGEENSARAKADRIGRKHRGTWPASKTPLRSRGFAKTRGDAR